MTQQYNSKCSVSLHNLFEARSSSGQRKGVILVRVLKTPHCLTKRRTGGDEEYCHAVTSYSDNSGVRRNRK
jgi:hypothetical protein